AGDQCRRQSRGQQGGATTAARCCTHPGIGDARGGATGSRFKACIVSARRQALAAAVRTENVPWKAPSCPAAS
ncbi:hypothetical protein, partial [Marinobacter adhaerens]|uniref:hypothetical protein n=1 Tax=Marinobacter adhaerens TaxID=1033846 RepID=UPI003C687627